MTKLLLHTLVITLYFLALINSISKVSVLAVLSSAHEQKDFMHVAAKASLVAGVILLVSMLFGNVVLQSVFRVELYSLRLAGGSVLCWVGFNALRKGVFFEQDTHTRFEDVAIVRLTGLVVMTIGTQMVLDGLAIWHVEALR